MARETKNVKISVLKHFEDQLSPSHAVDWPGVDFDTQGETAWLEPRLLGFSPVASRSGDRVETWTLNVNAYAKVGPGGESIHKPEELVDDVIGVFSQSTIALKDWELAGDPVVGYLRFTEGTVTPVPGSGGRSTASEQIAQLNVSFDFVLIV